MKKSICHAEKISYYLGVETISKNLVEALRRGNQTGLNPPGASFQVVSIFLKEGTLPVQGLRLAVQPGWGPCDRAGLEGEASSSPGWRAQKPVLYSRNPSPQAQREL